MLSGTYSGLQRYIEKRQRLFRWKYQYILDNFKYGFKKWRFNLVDHIDQVYCSTWDKADKDLILEEYKQIRLGETTPNQITRKIERFYNDQTVYFDKRPIRFEPQECVRTLDQITDNALTWLTQMHAGRSQILMSHISQGTGTTTPDRTDTTLETEVIRRPILEDGGYIDFLGHNELYGLIFSFDQANINCSESGLHNTGDITDPTDVMYCRNKFSPALVHTKNSNAISINIVIQHRAF